MSKARSKVREKELQEFIQSTKGQSYTERTIGWFKKNLNEIVTSGELAQLPGKNDKPISHSMIRVFELRDEKGFDIINWQSKNKSEKTLKVDEWILLNENPDPSKIRSRGVNKKIRNEVFTRDNFTCQQCGRTPDDEDPFREGQKIKLHVGHIFAHKQKDEGKNLNDKKLEAKDFLTQCHICNEGGKNENLKIITPIDRVLKYDQKTQKNIYLQLKKKFS